MRRFLYHFTVTEELSQLPGFAAVREGTSCSAFPRHIWKSGSRSSILVQADFFWGGGGLNVCVVLKKMEEVVFTCTFISARTIKTPTHEHKRTLFYPPGGFLVISIFHKGAHAVPIISGLQSAAASTYSFLRGQQCCTDTAANLCLCLCAGGGCDLCSAVDSVFAGRMEQEL